MASTDTETDAFGRLAAAVTCKRLEGVWRADWDALLDYAATVIREGNEIVSITRSAEIHTTTNSTGMLTGTSTTKTINTGIKERRP